MFSHAPLACMRTCQSTVPAARHVAGHHSDFRRCHLRCLSTELYVSSLWPPERALLGLPVTVTVAVAVDQTRTQRLQDAYLHTYRYSMCVGRGHTHAMRAPNTSCLLPAAGSSAALKPYLTPHILAQYLRQPGRCNSALAAELHALAHDLQCTHDTTTGVGAGWCAKRCWVVC